MQLFFSYPKQHIRQISPQPVIINQQSNPKYINTNIPTVAPIVIGSMFERIKYSGKCNSCSGVK
jgi:hypothetical protein